MMSELSKKPKVDPASLPETFLTKFKCSKCKKYLRPPIWIICKSGHSVCDLCLSASGTSTCPGSKGSCQRVSENIRNFAAEDMIKDLNLPISCKNQWCDFSGNLDSVITHEEDCPYRMVACPVMGCKMRIRLHLIENHMAEKHPKMSNGQWEILPERERDAVPCRFAVKSWLYGGTRIFAILISGTESLWHLLVIAACGRNDAEKLRAEIRLSSNLVPDCNDVFNRPVSALDKNLPYHYNSERELVWDKYSSCLHIHKNVVWQHLTGGPQDLQVDTAIPFTIKIFEKVFFAPDKADNDEKDESDPEVKIECDQD